MRTVCIIQARLTSTRLPDKVVLPLMPHGATALDMVIGHARAVPGVDEVVIAIPDTDANTPLVNHIPSGVRVYRGSEEDVLARYYEAAKASDAELIVRITADCPLLDPDVAGAVVALAKQTGTQYASNMYPARTFPDGLDVEVFTMQTLELAYVHATDTRDREHVTPYLQREYYREAEKANLRYPGPSLGRWRWTLDTQEDAEFLKRLIEVHSERAGRSWGVEDLKETVMRTPELWWRWPQHCGIGVV